MSWPPVDLCCSESSEDMSSPSGTFSPSTLSSSSRQTVQSCVESGVTAAPQVLADNIRVREDLEYLLLREGQGPQPFNYIPLHTFMSHEHREFLVQSINSVSIALGFITRSILTVRQTTTYMHAVPQFCGSTTAALIVVKCII